MTSLVSGLVVKHPTFLLLMFHAVPILPRINQSYPSRPCINKYIHGFIGLAATMDSYSYYLYTYETMHSRPGGLQLVYACIHNEISISEYICTVPCEKFSSYV